MGGECVACAGDGGCGSTDAGTRAPLGESCISDDECASDLCLPAELGGVCSTDCADADDCGEVGNALCTVISFGEGPRTVCALTRGGALPTGTACTADEECRGRLCYEGQCTEVCDSADDCVLGQTCTTLTHGATASSYLGCGYAPREGAVAIEEVDLGEASVLAGRGVDAALALPPDAVSLTLQARRVGGDPLPLTFIAVTDPHTTDIFDLSRIVELEDQPLRWLPLDTGDSVAMLVPNSTPDRIPFVGGLWRWSVGAFGRSTSDTGRTTMNVSAIITRADDISAGTLDLNVFLVGVGVSAAAAPGNPRLQDSLARFDAILRDGANIGVGAVEYFDVSGADATRYAVIDSVEGEDSELAGLFRLSAPRAGRRLNVFLVQSIEAGGEGFRAIGIAGGIPGPVGLHGSQHSGVVVAFDPAIVGSSDAVGHVLAHEAGHYLGLFHSTERAQPCEPHETPGVDDCGPFGAGDTLADTAYGDRDNLMYFRIVDGGANHALSAGQSFVLRRNPLVIR